MKTHIPSPIQFIQARDAMLLKVASDLLEAHKKFLEECKRFDELVMKKKGDKGDSPTEEELMKLIKPLIPTDQQLTELIISLIPEVKDGETPSDERLLELIEKAMPVIRHGETPSEEYLVKLMKKHLIPKVQKLNLDEIAKKVAPLIKVKEGTEVKEIDSESLLHIFTKKGKKLKTEHVDGLEQTLSALRNQISRGYLHGGGDTVSAGSGISITVVNGTKVISALGTGVVGESPVITGNTATLAHTPTPGTLRLFLNGLRQKEGTNISNGDYSVSGTTITFFQSGILLNATLLADYAY